MSRFEAANVIRLFDFYLAAMFVLSLARRYRHGVLDNIERGLLNHGE